jgi:hypothetical protein
MCILILRDGEIILDLAKEIARADAEEITLLLKMILQRYSELVPDRELSVISLSKSADQKEQLEKIIPLLQGRKTDS